MYMLDTNICIYVLKKHSDKLRHKFKVTKNICISSITYGELCFGIENGDRSKREARWDELNFFTQRLLIDSWDEEAAKHYGAIRSILKKQGTPIGNNDLLIAAHARSLGHIIVTNNVGEFSRVPNLIVENWISE
ncbi:type II toxin-antitoxin system tRNA(fMet)-specific endonuclease VapC [sulfur-oxidizing endosymbiont of Gigantopelta aegis]|uniref:type II toxin-antitoxin system tRNA(fMet)-specific endonuclease VapC n=1 Tax=sulfur-oxidizing endosymbiont of Gigantopelta aegis TaxID=2794934 RepID=UPI0018DCCB9C|nr:PIN domain-containing protein [sulfur-oxidizing endosymbiont of Gigantopelta aegis]